MFLSVGVDDSFSPYWISLVRRFDIDPLPFQAVPDFLPAAAKFFADLRGGHARLVHLDDLGDILRQYLQAHVFSSHWGSCRILNRWNEWVVHNFLNMLIRCLPFICIADAQPD